MAAVYYKSREEAALKAVPSFEQFKNEPLTVVSLDTDALTIGAQLSSSLQCPLQLYMANEVAIAGDISLGGVNLEGGFSYSSDISDSQADYYYQEFHGYIDDAKRAAFSDMNRELGNRTVIRKDLLNHRSIIVVTDCLTSAVPLDSFISYLKPVTVGKLYVCAPIVKADLVSHLRQVSDFVYFEGTVDFFYGKDHYFEDNSVYERSAGIDLVNNYLQLWPAT